VRLHLCAGKVAHQMPELLVVRAELEHRRADLSTVPVASLDVDVNVKQNHGHDKSELVDDRRDGR
jgi:hypothetical protein